MVLTELSEIEMIDLFYNSYLTQFDLVHGPISTFNELTIYEYNQHNELIHTSSIYENSKLNFKAHKDAVYAIIKENFNKFDYLANPIPSFKSKVVYLGDSYELTRHIGFGFTEKNLPFVMKVKLLTFRFV